MAGELGYPAGVKRLHEEGTLAEWYRALFDEAGDAIFIHDVEGRFLDVNNMACSRLGYSRDELLLMRVQDIDAPHISAAFAEKMEQFLKLGAAVIDTCPLQELLQS